MLFMVTSFGIGLYNCPNAIGLTLKNMDGINQYLTSTTGDQCAILFTCFVLLRYVGHALSLQIVPLMIYGKITTRVLCTFDKDLFVNSCPPWILSKFRGVLMVESHPWFGSWHKHVNVVILCYTCLNCDWFNHWHRWAMSREVKYTRMSIKSANLQVIDHYFTVIPQYCIINRCSSRSNNLLNVCPKLKQFCGMIILHSMHYQQRKTWTLLSTTHSKKYALVPPYFGVISDRYYPYLSRLPN